MALTVDNGKNSTVVFLVFHQTHLVSHRLDFLLHRISPEDIQNRNMVDALPVPKTLEAQLSKCKAVRESTHYKSREKTPAVCGALRKT
jgi:hypothetical protein